VSLAASITEAQLMEDLGKFLVACSGVEVIQGQTNRTPEPKSADFIVMTPSHRARQATNWTTYAKQNADAISYTQPTEVRVQLDFHGDASADVAQVIGTLFRSSAAVDAFREGISPLYADDAAQMPFLNGENQYENRWVVMAYLQVNPTVSTPQQFADTVRVDLVEVDTTFPP
jgi:hypothetical protein